MLIEADHRELSSRVRSPNGRAADGRRARVILLFAAVRPRVRGAVGPPRIHPSTSGRLDASIRSRDDDGAVFKYLTNMLGVTDTIGTVTGNRRVPRRSTNREQSYEQHVPPVPAMAIEAATTR